MLTDQILVAQTNARLQNLKKDLKFFLDTTNRGDLVQLLHTIEPLVFDGVEFSAPHLYSILCVYEGKFTSVFARENLDQFIHDLELLIRFEDGGLESLNDFIDHRFQECVRTQAMPEGDRARSLLRYALFRMIALFPHIVRGIEIHLPRAKQAKVLKNLENDGSLRRNGSWSVLLNELGKKGESAEVIRVLPPSGQFSGTVDEAYFINERHAIEILPNIVKFRGEEKRRRVTVLGLIVEHAPVVRDYVYFLFDEVEKIVLTMSADYTPCIDRVHYEDALRPRLDFLTHYLVSRRFMGMMGNLMPNDIPFSEEEWRKVSSTLLTTHPANELWHNGWIGSVNAYTPRFVAVRDKEKGIFLYEFPDMVEFATQVFRTTEELAAIAHYVCGGKKSMLSDQYGVPTFKVYEGDAIIARLAEIPLEKVRV